MFRSANTFWPSSARPYGATRRPLSSTRVEEVPRPRSEMPEAPEAKPPPKVVGTEPWLSTARVCSSSATLDLPDFSISAAFRVCTGEAVSASARRMFEPVISTRAIGAAFGVSCASAGKAAGPAGRWPAPEPAALVADAWKGTRTCGQVVDHAVLRKRSDGKNRRCAFEFRWRSLSGIRSASVVRRLTCAYGGDMWLLGHDGHSRSLKENARKARPCGHGAAAMQAEHQNLYDAFTYRVRPSGSV